MQNTSPTCPHEALISLPVKITKLCVVFCPPPRYTYSKQRYLRLFLIVQHVWCPSFPGSGCTTFVSSLLPQRNRRSVWFQNPALYETIHFKPWVQHWEARWSEDFLKCQKCKCSNFNFCVAVSFYDLWRVETTRKRFQWGFATCEPVHLVRS